LINSTAITVENRGVNAYDSKIINLNFFHSKKITIQFRKKNEQRIVKGNATIPDLDEPNKLLVKFPNSFSAGKYDVWTTDYKNYAVVYSCTTIVPYVFKVEFIWILSRQPTLNDDTVRMLKNKLEAAEVSISDFEKTVQTNCNY
jgi:lipocalin